jgi:hypothetical protein
MTQDKLTSRNSRNKVPVCLKIAGNTNFRKIFISPFGQSVSKIANNVGIHSRVRRRSPQLFGYLASDPSQSVCRAIVSLMQCQTSLEKTFNMILPRILVALEEKALEYASRPPPAQQQDPQYKNRYRNRRRHCFLLSATGRKTNSKATYSIGFRR